MDGKSIPYNDDWLFDSFKYIIRNPLDYGFIYEVRYINSKCHEN